MINHSFKALKLTYCAPKQGMWLEIFQICKKTSKERKEVLCFWTCLRNGKNFWIFCEKMIFFNFLENISEGHYS